MPNLTSWRLSSTTAPEADRSRVAQTSVPVDSDCIPTRAPYSITSFLDSLPTPSLSDTQFVHLHNLAALTPPEVGSAEFNDKKEQLLQMIRLVEGVRESDQIASAGGARASHDEIPDGRIWPEDEGIPLDWDRDVKAVLQENKEDGRKLLKLAKKKHLAGYYSVNRQQRGDVE